MNAIRNARKATFILGALLSAGLVLAQAPTDNQAPSANAPQAAPAQPGNLHHNFDPNRQAVHMGKRLGLSNDQVAQIKPILADRFQQMQTLRADTSLSQQDRHAKVRALMQNSDTRIESLLNDTQKQQFERMLAERRAHQHNRQTPAASQPQA
jgi:Spy/CpxP family protein refolding chaperone